MRIRYPLTAMLLVFLASTPALAEDPGRWQDSLQLHGFASLTAVTTSANRFFGDSQDTSFDFSEIGLNASWRLTPRLLLSGQLLSRRAGDMYNGTLALDYALLDLKLAETAEHRMGLRLGRLKNPLGLYNETRDVPFTRPTIFLPQVIYFDKIRNLVLSTDGAGFYGDLDGTLGSLALTLNLGTGQALVDENVEWTLLGTNFPGDLEAAGPTWVGSLWYATEDERLRLGLSALGSAMEFRPAGPWSLDPGRTEVLYTLASAQYNHETWSLSAEYLRLPIRWKEFGPWFPYRKSTPEGYYLQGTYRPAPAWELTLRYEEGFADRDDRSGHRQAAAVAALGGTTPPFDFYARIWTLGLRWDITPRLMVRLDYQRHQGTYALSFRENPDPDQLVRDWDMIAIQAAIRF